MSNVAFACLVCRASVTKTNLSSTSEPETETNAQPQKLKLEDYGTKVATLIKHLREIRDKDPTTKSIVFSQWNGVLALVEAALKLEGIVYARLEGKPYPAMRRF